MSRGPTLKINVTQDDIDEARRLGLTGREHLARVIFRENPEVTSVEFSADLKTITVGWRERTRLS